MYPSTEVTTTTFFSELRIKATSNMTILKAILPYIYNHFMSVNTKISNANPGHPFNVLGIFRMVFAILYLHGMPGGQCWEKQDRSEKEKSFRIILLLLIAMSKRKKEVGLGERKKGRGSDNKP